MARLGQAERSQEVRDRLATVLEPASLLQFLPPLAPSYSAGPALCGRGQEMWLKASRPACRRAWALRAACDRLWGGRGLMAPRDGFGVREVLRLFPHQAGELAKLGLVQIGYGPVAEAAASPMEDVVAAE